MFFSIRNDNFTLRIVMLRMKRSNYGYVCMFILEKMAHTSREQRQLDGKSTGENLSYSWSSPPKDADGISFIEIKQKKINLTEVKPM